MDLPKHPPAAPTKRATCPSMPMTCKKKIRRHGFSGAAERIRRNRRSRSALLAAYGTGNRKTRPSAGRTNRGGKGYTNLFRNAGAGRRDHPPQALGTVDRKRVG